MMLFSKAPNNVNKSKQTKTILKLITKKYINKKKHMT